MNRIDLSLILPCFNEASHFNQSFRAIQEVLVRSSLQYEILLIDDGSSDETPELIRLANGKSARIKAFFHSKNQGRGATVAHGIRKAQGTIVGYMDIDCEVSPRYIPACVRLIADGKAEVVVGARRYQIRGSILRAIHSTGYRYLADWMLGTGGIDTESGYKFFRKDAIAPILSQVKHQRWFWDTEIIVLVKRAGLRIAQVPVEFVRRSDKQSTVQASVDIPDYLISLVRLRNRLIWKR